MKIKVLLISKLEKNLNMMKTMIDDEEIIVIGESMGGSAALGKIESTSPDMIIMSLGVGDTDILNLTERIILHRPKTHVILLTEYLDVDLLQSAMKVGAHNVTLFPTSSREFADYIKSVYHYETIRISSLNQRQSLSWMSRVITVFGAKGGLGKTTLAVNLAVKLSQQGSKVALVDLDLQFGDLAIFLDIDPADTLLELMEESFPVNIDAIRSYMTVHPSGVHILCGPRSPEYADMISGEKVQNLLNLLRSYYDFVIIDASSYFNDVAITAIETASIILFVTSMEDIAILKNSKLSLSLLKSLQQIDKVKLIINKADDNNTLTQKDVQEILGLEVFIKVQTDVKVARAALNRGIPFVISSPSSKLAKSVLQLVDLLESGGNSYNPDKSEKQTGKLIKKNDKRKKKEKIRA